MNKQDGAPVRHPTKLARWRHEITLALMRHARGGDRSMQAAMSEVYFQDLASCVPMSRAQEQACANAMVALREKAEALRDDLAQVASEPCEAEACEAEAEPRMPSAATQRERRARLAEVERQLQVLRGRLAKANLRLVVKIANQFRRPGQSLSDLIQEGNLGLLTAVDRFDPTRGLRLTTYAAWWIKHHVRMASTNTGRTIPIPAHVVQLAARLRRLEGAFEKRQARVPSMAELAKEAGVSERKARRALQASAHAMSLDAPRGASNCSVGEMLADAAPSSLLSMVDEQRRNDVDEALAVLKPIEADVLRHRFSFFDDAPMSLREIGEAYSLSRERIRQIQNRALAKMRERLSHHASMACV